MYTCVYTQVCTQRNLLSVFLRQLNLPLELPLGLPTKINLTRGEALPSTYGFLAILHIVLSMPRYFP